MDKDLLKFAGVEKVFGAEFRLGPLNFALQPGETVAVMGKNGAGKSTLFQICTGNLDATAGTVLFAGEKLTPENFALKRRIGYLPQGLGLPRWVTAHEFLHYATSLMALPNPVATIAAALVYWDCVGFQHRPLAACSHGMQKRVGLALATIHDPELLLLDEPFSGLDLFHTRALVDKIRERSRTGKTTIICTHIAPYAAALCSQALIISDGQVRSLAGWQGGSESQRIKLIEDCFFSS